MGTAAEVFKKTLRLGRQVRAFAIFELPNEGWVAFEERDSHVLRTRMGDWHKVERTMDRFVQTITGLQRDGWQEAHA